MRTRLIWRRHHRSSAVGSRTRDFPPYNLACASRQGESNCRDATRGKFKAHSCL
jgi:hypothetical protein